MLSYIYIYILFANIYQYSTRMWSTLISVSSIWISYQHFSILFWLYSCERKFVQFANQFKQFSDCQTSKPIALHSFVWQVAYTVLKLKITTKKVLYFSSFLIRDCSLFYGIGSHVVALYHVQKRYRFSCSCLIKRCV